MSAIYTCVICDKHKTKNQVIEGLNGDICRDCIAIMHSLEDTQPTHERPVKKGFDIRLVKEALDARVLGQEHAKKQLIMERYKKSVDPHHAPNNVLLIGDSGVGKTYLIRSLADILGVPFMEVDTTAYSETGYKGKDVADILEALIIQEDGNKEAIENAIVFIDEIDKVTTTNNGEPSTKVQHGLLKVVEGMPYSYHVSSGHKTYSGVIDTSKILFVGAGACTGLAAIKANRETPVRAIGFGSPHIAHGEAATGYTSQDLIQYGFIPELVGRFPLILELHPLSEGDIAFLLTDHPDSIIKQAQTVFLHEGIALTVTDSDIDWLVSESMKHPLGVRSIAHVLTKELNTRLFDALCSGETEVTLKSVCHQPSTCPTQRLSQNRVISTQEGAYTAL